jgi:hypothetical protein
MKNPTCLIALLAISFLSGCSDPAANNKQTTANNTAITSNNNTLTTSNKSSSPENASAENAKLQAKSCVEAQYQADNAKYVECLHPEIIKVSGGKEKVTADLNQMSKMVGKISYTSLDVSTPKEVKTIGKAMAAVVPYQMKRKNAVGEEEISKDFLIGVSEDGGKTWKFATSAMSSPLEKSFPGVKDLETP